VILFAACALLGVAAANAQTRSTARSVAPGQWLSLCSKCANPKVFSSSGIGTASARAEARLTRADVLSTDGPCDGDNTSACIQRETTRVYRAAADCTAGKITTVLDESFTLAGIWDNSDIGGGRSKWRGADGQIVGRDNASNGLAISDQWEVLCPAPVTAALIARAQTAARQSPAAATAPRPNPPACGGERLCTEVNDFAVTMVDFRASLAAARKVLTATLRFQNKTTRPLILAYVPGSAIATDERGNRYGAVDTDVRGIGLVGRTIDAKFVLQPGQRSDARLTYIWDAGRTAYGTAFDVEMTVREIVDQGNNQVTLGAEYPLRLPGLVDGARAGAATSAAPPAVSAAPASAPAGPQVPAPGVDNCAGSKAPCFDSGVFTMTVTGFAGSVIGNRHHSLRINVEIKNNTDQPLLLAYKHGTNSATDNLGNRYGFGRPGTYDSSVQGIGILIPGRSVDAQFQLAPRSARSAVFSVIRYESGPKPTGIAWAFDTVLAELRPLPNGTQTEVVRDHSVHVTDLRIGGTAAATAPGAGAVVDKLRGILGGGQKK
jgi:hypothetical protein